jgi:hypothetical protein
MLSISVGDLVPMVNHSGLQTRLPCRADRQKILEQAILVLAEARGIATQVERTFGSLSAERPAECAKTAAASVVHQLPQPWPANGHDAAFPNGFGVTG